MGEIMARVSDALFGTKKRKIISITVIAILAILLIAYIIVSSVTNSVMNKLTYVSDEELDSLMASGTDVSDTDVVSGADTLTAEEIAAAEAMMAESSVTDLTADKDIYNILVLGSDTRTKDVKLKTRTDVIILLTINKNTQKIVMSSIMRDSWVSVPGSGSKKINAACAKGGPKLAVQTVEKNFGVKIDKFVMVNFYTFINVVDALGGVTVDLSKDEMNTMNNYINELNTKWGRDLDADKMTEYGDGMHLNGMQAMGYVRNRYNYDATSGENNDQARTARQREVLGKLIEKAKQTSIGDLLDIINEIADYVATDMTKDEIISLAKNSLTYKDYKVEQHRIPVDGSYKGGIFDGKYKMLLDFDKNKAKLHSWMTE